MKDNSKNSHNKSTFDGKNSPGESKIHSLNTLNKILAFTAAGILVIILAVTLLSPKIKNSRTEINSNTENSLTAQSQQAGIKTGIKNSARPAENISFLNIGELRISSKPDSELKSMIVIIAPQIPYEKTDITFYEELDRKKSEIRILVENYFSSKTFAEITAIDELKIKEDLKNGINSLLVLGKINEIYFSEYQFL